METSELVMKMEYRNLFKRGALRNKWSIYYLYFVLLIIPALVLYIFFMLGDPENATQLFIICTLLWAATCAVVLRQNAILKKYMAPDSIVAATVEYVNTGDGISLGEDVPQNALLAVLSSGEKLIIMSQNVVGPLNKYQKGDEICVACFPHKHTIEVIAFKKDVLDKTTMVVHK